MLSTEESSSSFNENGEAGEQFQSLYRALRLLLGVVKEGVRNLEPETDRDDDTASASVVKDFSEEIQTNNETAITDVVEKKNATGEEEKASVLTDVIFLMKSCANLCKADTLTVSDAQFLDSLTVLVLMWIGEYVENIDSLQLSSIMESVPMFFDYLLKVLNQKVNKLRRPKSGSESSAGAKTNSSEIPHALLPCEVIILLLESMTKDINSDSKPEVVNAWEDLLDSRGIEISEVNSPLLQTFKLHKDNFTVSENISTQKSPEDNWNAKSTLSRIHELLHCSGIGQNSDLLSKLKDTYREILRNQKVPDKILDELDAKSTSTDESKKRGVKDDSANDTSLLKAKLRLKHQLKSMSTGTEQFDFEPFAMFSEKPSNKFHHSSLTYLLDKNFPRLILSFYSRKSCFDKLDVSFKQLVPSETNGIFSALVFDWSKAKENVENLRKILDLIKYVKTAVNLTIRSPSHCLLLCEDLVRALVECIAGSLVFVLSEIIATAASAKRESFREDNSNVVQELIPYVVDLIQSVSLVINQQNTNLQHLATAMIGWLHVSFLHGLSKSQYSMATERQTSSRSTRRNYSRSYSFRSGSPGILTNAILSIVEQSYKALSKITQFAPLYVDSEDVSSSLSVSSMADNKCGIFINAIFVQINTTSLSFWLLNVLLKKAISLNPLKSTQGSKSTKNLESEFLEEVEFHPYLSQVNRKEIKIGKTTFAVGESGNLTHNVSGQASSETLNAGPAATSSGEVQTDNANAETNESSNLVGSSANAVDNEQNPNQIYNALPVDSETDNSSTTGGNSLFEEAMLDEDADDDDYTEEDEDDDDHDEDDQDDEDVEEDMVIDAQEGEEDVDWVDHAAIIELINETEGSNQNTGMAEGSLAAATQQADNLIVMGTTLISQSGTIPEQANETAEEQNDDQEEEDSFLATLEGSGNEAILKLLFQDENNVDVTTKEQNDEAKTDENGVTEWQKMATYLRSCRLIVKLLLDNAFTPGNMLNKNMKEYFSANQSSALASVLRELESMQLDIYTGLPLPHTLESFKKLTYKLVHAFISSEFSNTLEKQCSFLRDLGFKWDQDEGGLSCWPLTVPLPWLSLLAQVILFAEDNTLIVTQIWKKVIETLVCKVETTIPANQSLQTSKNDAEKDATVCGGNFFNIDQDLSPYQLQLLQFAFYQLNTCEKSQLVKCICDSILKVSSNSQERNSAHNLYISRLCLILEFMLNHFSNAPANLADQVESNLFESTLTKIATDTCVSAFLESGILNSQLNSKKSPITEGMEVESLQKHFYDINGASTDANIPASTATFRLPRACKEGLKALMTCGVNYNEFYESLLKLIKLPTVEKQSDFADCLSSAYLFGILLRVCSLLPPSIQFMNELSQTLCPYALNENLVYPMIQIMWTARLSSEFYAPFVSHALEQNHPESKEIVERFKDGKLLFKTMLNILEQGLVLLDGAGEESKLPSNEKLLLLDMTASRIHSELEAQADKLNFDLEVIVTAIPLMDKFLDKVFELSRTYIIEQVKKLKNVDSLNSSEVFNCIIQSDFQVEPFKTILKTCNFFEKSLSNCEDFVELLHKNGESHLKEAILQWKAASGLSAIWDMKNAQSGSSSYKNYPIPSEIRGMQVLSAHIRCLMIEGQGVLLCLQHTIMSALNLFRDLIDWAPAELLTEDVVAVICSRSLTILNHETCDTKDNLSKSLDDFSEKIFKKASDRCPTGSAIASMLLNRKQIPTIPATVLRRVLSLLYDLTHFGSSSSFSVPLINECLQQMEAAFFSSNFLVSSAAVEMFSSSERPLFATLSMLNNDELKPQTINILLNFLYRIANEMLSQKGAEALESFSSNVDAVPCVAALLSKPQLETILETLFTNQLNCSKNVAFYDDKETFILFQNICKLLVDRASPSLPTNFVSTLLTRMIESARIIVQSGKQAEKYEKLMKLMLILANHKNGAGHVSLFKASLDFISMCTSNSTELLQSIDAMVMDAENGENAFPSADGTDLTCQVQMFNVIFIYVAEMLLQLTNKRVDEDFSLSGVSNFALQQLESVVATDSGDSRDINSQLSSEMTSESDLDAIRSGMVQKANSGEIVGAVASGESASPKLCTYTVTQTEFMNQHWYHCYSCSMHDSVGVCSVCAKLCHKHHDVTYAKFGSFYCDCGARGERYCKALSKASIEKHLKESQSSRHFESLTFESGLDKFTGDSGAPTKDDVVKGLLNDAALLSQNPKLRTGNSKSCSKVIADAFKTILVEIAMNSNLHNVVQLMLNLRTAIQKHLYNTSPSNSSKRLEKCFAKLHDADVKTVNIVTNLANLTARSVESTFENVKMSFSGEHGATMRQLITAHMIRRTAMCLVPPKLVNPSPSSSQSNFPILIVAHDKGLLTCVDTANLLKQSESVTGKKLNIDRLATSTVPMTILSICSNNSYPEYLAVTGIKDCHVLVYNCGDCSISSQLSLNLSLDAGNFIIKSLWIPGSQTQLAIITADFIKIYDLAYDLQTPIYFYHLLSGKLRDVTFLINSATNSVNLLIMSSQGFIYTQVLDDQSRAENGPFYVTNNIVLESSELKMSNGQFGSGGLSIYYSHTMQMLFFSFSNAKSFACSLKKLEELPTSTVLNKIQLLTNTSALCHWKEIEDHAGVILASDEKSGTVSFICVCPDSFQMQEVSLSPARCKTLDVVGVRTSCDNGIKSTSIMILADDGGLKVFTVNSAEKTANFWISPTFNPSTDDYTAASYRKKMKPTSMKIKQQIASASTASIVEFPIDYFENCQALEEVEFGGNDYLQVYNRKQMKNRLKYINQYLAASKSTPIIMEITNENSSMLISGLRVQVGFTQSSGTSPDRAPTFLEIFGRQVSLEPLSSSRWVDLPFTTEECMMSEKSVTLTIGNSRDPSGITIVDSVKVYGKHKSSFASASADLNETVSPGTVADGRNGVGVAKRDEFADLFGLRNLEGESELYATPQSFETAFDLFISHCLEILSLHFNMSDIDPKSKSAKEAKELASYLTSCPLPASVSIQNKNLLFSIFKSKEKLYSHVDEISLNCVARALQSSNVSPETFERHLHTIKHIAQNRPKNLIKFSAQMVVTRDCAEDLDGERISNLVEDVMSKFWSVVEDRCNVKLLVPLVNQTRVKNEVLVSAVVEILFTFGIQDSDLMPHMMTHLVSLLLFHDPTISFVAKSALNRLTRPHKQPSQMASSRNVVTKPLPTSNNQAKENPEATRSELQRRPVDVAPIEQPPAPSGSIAASVRASASLRDHLLQNLNAPSNPGAIDTQNEQPNVPHNELDALLNVAPLLEIPNDADDEAMMELAIALSLQDQPGTSNNEAPPIPGTVVFEPHPPDHQGDEPEAAVVASLDEPSIGNLSIEPHVEFVETPDISNLQGDSTDETGSAVGTDDEEEESLAATDGSALPVENLSTQAAGSGEASEDGNSLAGESIQTTASASSSAYGGEEPVNSTSHCLNTGVKNAANTTSTHLGSTETMNLNTSFVMEESSTCKLADSRTEMLKLMMNYLPQVCNVGGIRAVPFLQVFLSLSLEIENEQVIALVLEKVISQLKLKVDPGIFSRNFSKEVQVLLLRLLSMYMQKTSKVDEISALAKMTANALHNKGIIEFCRLVVSEMLPYWRNSFVHVELDRSLKLLRAQPVQSPPDMHPFFLASYVIGHQADVFEAYHQLLTEVTLRIPYQAYRLLEMEIHPDIKKDWINCLSQYMILPSQYVRHQVRKLLQFICGTKEAYRLQRDLYVFRHHFDAIQTIFDNYHKILRKQNPDSMSKTSTNDGSSLFIDMDAELNGLELSISSNFVSLDYGALITVVEHLKQVLEAAVGRCYSWFKFCESRPSVLKFLMKLASITSEAIHPYILELIILATCGSKAAVLIKTNSGAVDRPKKQIPISTNKNTEKTTSGEEDTNSSPECTEETCKEYADLLVSTYVNYKEWESFLSTFFLECSSPSLRWQIHGLVRSLWKSISAKSQFKLVKVLWDIWDVAAGFGKRASQLVDILGFVTLKSDIDPESLQLFGEKLTALLQEQNERLQNHPNFFLYEKLLHVVEFDGFYLENDPCIVCHSRENSSVLTKLSSIKADSRFTTTTQIIKLTSPYQINSIVCRITDINNSKMVKSMAIYYNKRTVASVVELKNNPQVWHRARKVTLEAGQSEVKIEFTLPVVATNLMMEVCDFYENFHVTSESLQCPRCSSSVMANPGICGNCGENVFQCHKCRQINYDEKDPFLCSSCGFCKYAKFDFTLNAKPCLSAVDPIEHQDDRKRAISALNGLLETADSLTKSVQSQHPYLEDMFHRLDAGECVTNIYSLGSPEMRNITLHSPAMSMNSPIGHGSSNLIHKVIQNIAMKYYECKMSFEELSIVSDKIIATRAELFDYDRKNNLITVYSDAFCCSDRQRKESADDDNGLEFGQLRKKEDLQVSTKRCFGCLVHSAIHSIYLLKAFVTSPVVKPLISSRILDTLLIGPNIRHVCGKVQSLANGLIMTVCRNDETNTNFFCQTLMKSIKKVAENSFRNCRNSPQSVSTKALHDQVSLLVSYIDLKDSCWNMRLQAVTQLLMFGVHCNNAPVITHIVLPCMKAILNVIQTPSNPPQASKREEGLVNIHDWFLGKEVFVAWAKPDMETTGKENSANQELNSNSWIKAALFHPGSRIVRQVACQILESLACRDEKRCEIILMLIMNFIEDSCCSMHSNQDLADLMSLVQKLACKDDLKVILSRHGVPKRIAELILSEIGNFTEKEKRHGPLASKSGSNRGSTGGVCASWSHDLCQGVRLRCLSELLSGLLEVNEILNQWKAQLIQPILHGYLAAKKLVSQRTKAIDEAQDTLLEMLDLMTTGTVEETAEFMKICVLTLQQFPTDDQLTPVFVFERLCNLIHPEQADTSPEFALCLEKDPQQEDFLSGRMQGNPYNSSEPGMGPLMRDVKNKICRDCELVALLEDDNGMELLVNNRIISLSLPVAEVYQKVWLATERGGDTQNEGEPMRVVYRMRGLMGDATEEFIENLNARSAGAESNGEENSTIEEEEKYKLAAVLAECNGFHVMLNSLNSISDVFASKHLMYVLLKLFSYCVKLRSNRIALVSREYDTLKVFLKLLQLVLNMPETVASNTSASTSSFRQTNNEASATRNELVEKVLLVMQPILLETQNVRSLEISGNLEQLDQILSCMNISHVQQNPLLLHNLMTIVPYLSFGDNSTTKMSRIIEFFKPFIDFEKYNEDKITTPELALKTELFIDCFIAMVESIPASEDGNQLKSLITKHGVLSNCTNYVLNLTPGKEYLADQKAWKEYLARPAVPYVLKMMKALSKSHEENQIALSKGCIPVLHRLERVASEEQVGTLAENLLETLKENRKVSEIITGARKQTREEKKRLAMAMRAKQLETLGLEATSGGRVVKTSSSHNVTKFEELTEETGPICCICREGYKYHPKSVMGIYVFAKKHVIEQFEQSVRIEASQRSGDGGIQSISVVPRGPMTAKAQGYSTVSSFNTVHYDCHNNAVRSHRGRDEWESATLQNADVKCNGILPMWGAQVSESHFANSLARYNAHLQESTGLREPTYNTTVHDCKLLLLKFAEEKSFSEDCGGGARQSNTKLIPYLLNIALYVLNSTRNAPREELLVNQFIQDPVDKWVRNSFEAEGPHFYTLMQLLVMNQNSFWAQNCIHFLQRLLVCVHVRSAVQQPLLLNNPVSVQITQKDYKVYKPALMYFTLVNSLSNALQKAAGKPGRSWSEELMDYVKMNDTSLLEGLEKNFLGTFEEALSAESFSEWCDIVGLLPVIGPENVDQFVMKTLQKINPEVNL